MAVPVNYSEQNRVIKAKIVIKMKSILLLVLIVGLANALPSRNSHCNCGKFVESFGHFELFEFAEKSRATETTNSESETKRNFDFDLYRVKEIYFQNFGNEISELV